MRHRHASPGVLALQARPSEALRTGSVAPRFLLLAVAASLAAGAISAMVSPWLAVAAVGGAVLLVWVARHPEAGLLLLIVLLPFSATELMPRQVLGVPGLSPYNGILLATLAAIILARWNHDRHWRFPPAPTPLRIYLLMLVLGGLGGAFFAHRIPPLPGASEQELIITTVPSYLTAYLAKPLIQVAVAMLAGLAVLSGVSRQRLLLALMCSLAGVSLLVLGSVLAGGKGLDQLSGIAARNHLSWTGLHANELGLFANIGLALLVFTRRSLRDPSQRALALAGMVLAVAAAALTFSRGAFIGTLVVLAAWLWVRRQASDLVFGLVAAGIAWLVLPEAFFERAGSGFAANAVTDVSAGRMDEIWTPLMAVVAGSPLWGHGLASVLWAEPNATGAMLPVSHTHSAYLGILLDFGLLGVAVVGVWLVSVWRLFRRLSRALPDPVWRGFFRGAQAALVVVLVQGVTDDSFLPTASQSLLWLAYGLGLGFAAEAAAPATPEHTS